jgi:hypothetical protein
MFGLLLYLMFSPDTAPNFENGVYAGLSVWSKVYWYSRLIALREVMLGMTSGGIENC